MSMVQALQAPTEKNQEEDREGIVMLRIYRVQVRVTIIVFCRRSRTSLL